MPAELVAGVVVLLVVVALLTPVELAVGIEVLLVLLAGAVATPHPAVRAAATASGRAQRRTAFT